MNFDLLFSAMQDDMERGPSITRPSKFWRDLNEAHAQRLSASGIENFRRTLARDYFTWQRVLPWDSQIRFLITQLPAKSVLAAVIGTFKPIKHEHIGLPESLALNFLTRLVWEYAASRHPELAGLTECEIGNPADIRKGGKFISQDRANSILEFNAYKSAMRGTVCELGGGYGRNANIAAQLGEFGRYVMVDIPPALGVAQYFLTQAFPDDRHFEFRSFDSYDEIKDEFEACRFAYLLPHQMGLLPDSSVDLFLNISSLHEMPRDQVDYYLREIRRLVAAGGHFYLKAWSKSNNCLEEVAINAEDYDLSGFAEIFWRQTPVQTRFFETLQRRTAPAADRHPSE